MLDSRDLPASGGAHTVKADFIAKALIAISKASKFDTSSAIEIVIFFKSKLDFQKLFQVLTSYLQAVSFLIPSHHSQVYKTHRNLWKLLVKNLGLDSSIVPALPVKKFVPI